MIEEFYPCIVWHKCSFGVDVMTGYDQTICCKEFFMSSCAERGICLPTVLLWLIFLYIEVAVRLRDLKNFPFQLDLCRPFAAHW